MLESYAIVGQLSEVIPEHLQEVLYSLAFGDRGAAAVRL
jgi:hypothetical protein